MAHLCSATTFAQDRFRGIAFGRHRADGRTPAARRRRSATPVRFRGWGMRDANAHLAASSRRALRRPDAHRQASTCSRACAAPARAASVSVISAVGIPAKNDWKRPLASKRLRNSEAKKRSPSRGTMPPPMKTPPREPRVKATLPAKPPSIAQNRSSVRAQTGEPSARPRITICSVDKGSGRSPITAATARHSTGRPIPDSKRSADTCANSRRACPSTALSKSSAGASVA
mmetsp:Transcript_41418/g.97066  ORF Transcript_41418/g.97066 Transcript_41418/m.97066 type:complete len:230 (+) Transcript_41418:3943-4632(+)